MQLVLVESGAWCGAGRENTNTLSYKISMEKVEYRISMKSVSAVPDVGRAERIQITSVEKLHQNSRFVSIEPKYLK